LIAKKIYTTAATVAEAAFNAVMNANPISIVIIAIAALVAAIVLLVKNWDTVKEKVIEVWNNMKETIQNTVEAVKAKIEDFKAAV
jgi:phage-related minor tail protein